MPGENNYKYQNGSFCYVFSVNNYFILSSSQGIGEGKQK